MVSVGIRVDTIFEDESLVIEVLEGELSLGDGEYLVIIAS